MLVIVICISSLIKMWLWSNKGISYSLCQAQPSAWGDSCLASCFRGRTKGQLVQIESITIVERCLLSSAQLKLQTPDAERGLCVGCSPMRPSTLFYLWRKLRRWSGHLYHLLGWQRTDSTFNRGGVTTWRPPSCQGLTRRLGSVLALSELALSSVCTVPVLNW